MRLINSFSLFLSYFTSLSFTRSNSEQDDVIDGDLCRPISKIPKRGEIIIGNMTDVMCPINTNLNIIW